jgi:hypothetical protein
MKMSTPNTVRPHPPRIPSDYGTIGEPAYLHPMIQEHLLAERALERWRVEQEQQTTPATTSNSANQSIKITKIIGDERHVITTKVYADGRKVTNTRISELTQEERQQHNGIGQMSSELPPGGTSNPETSNDDVQQHVMIRDVDQRYMHPSIQEDILAHARLQKQRQASERSGATNNPELPAAERQRQASSAPESSVAKTPELLHPYLQEHYLAEQAMREEEEQQKEENMLEEVKQKEKEDPGQLHPYLQEHYLALEEKPKLRLPAASSSQSLMQGYQADTALAQRRRQAEEEQIINEHEKQPSVFKKVKKRGGLLGRRKKDKTPTQEQQGNSQPPQNHQGARETITTRVPDEQGEDKMKEKPKKSGLFRRRSKKVKPPTQEKQANSQQRGKGNQINPSHQHRSAPPTSDAGDDRESSGAWKNFEVQPKVQQYLFERCLESQEIGMVEAATEGRPRPEVEGFLKLQDTALNSIQQQKRPDQPTPHREARASLPTKQLSPSGDGVIIADCESMEEYQQLASPPNTAGPRQTPSPSMQMASHMPQKTAETSLRKQANPNIHALPAAPRPPMSRYHPSKASSFTPGQGWENIITDDWPQKSKGTQNMGMNAVKEQQECSGDSYSGSRSTMSEQTPEASIEEEDDCDRPPITEHIVRHTAMSEVTTPWELQRDQQDGYDSMADGQSDAELSYDSMDYVNNDQWEALEKSMEKGGTEATRQWEAFLKSQGAQSERDAEEQEQQRSVERVPRPQQIDVGEERNPASQKVSEAQSESTTGIQTTFICACCHGSKRTKESGYSCDNLLSPHLVCSDCVRQYLWSTKDTRAPYGMLGSHAKPICQLPCFTSLDGRSSCHCPFKIHVQSRNLFKAQELKEWAVREQEHMQEMAPKSPLSATQKQTRVAAEDDRAAPLSPKQQIQVAMKEAATNARVRSCAMCDQTLNKSQNGCNAMKCLVCHTVSCYVCRQVVPPGGYDTHFDMFGDDKSKCPLLTAAETDRKREEEDMKRDIMALANQVLENYKNNN